MRCFVAGELSEEVRGWLSRGVALMRGGGGDGVKWVGADQWHVTLWFLGEVSEGGVVEVAQVVQRACEGWAAVAVRVGGLGVFGRPGRAQVLWCGVEDARACADWVARVAPGLEALGFARERREYVPHITLARAKSADGSRHLADLAARGRELGHTQGRISRVTLYESRLRPSGPEYVALKAWELGS